MCFRSVYNLSKNLRRIGLCDVRLDRTTIQGRDAVRVVIDGNASLKFDRRTYGEVVAIYEDQRDWHCSLVSNEMVAIEDDYHLRIGYTNLSSDLLSLRYEREGQ